MRSSPHLPPTCAVLSVWLLLAGTGHSRAQASVESVYRADALPPVRVQAPDEIQLVRSPGAPSWPREVSAELEERIRREWPASRIYGPVHSSLGVWLRDPLVTAQVGGRVLVPVIDGDALPIAGALELPDPQHARRVVVLVDASASANALASFPAGDAVERISVLEAERRALDQLLALLEQRQLEVGVIAFGESTWPVAEPGLPPAELRARLARFRAEHPRGEGRTDAVCALWTAHDWLESTPEGVAREIVLLTDGELPHSGRFAACDGPPAMQQTCRERRNRSSCPARRTLRSSEGESDLAQLAVFSRRARGQLRVTPLVFDPERAARVWEQLAIRTGSSLVRVPSPQAIEQVLPALVSNRIRGVRAHNATTNETTPELLEPQGSRFAGSLPLAPGANDVELRIQSARGLAALLRLRVYSEPGYLEAQLARLRRENDLLESHARELDERSRGEPAPAERVLEIRVPAANED